MKKNSIYVLLTAMALLFCLIACSDDDKKEDTIAADELTVDNTSVTLLQNDEITVGITSGNGGYSVKTLDGNIATASVADDKVVIKSAGEIGETSLIVIDGRKKSTQIKVRVGKLWDLTLDKDHLDLFKGGEATVKIETGNGGYTLTVEEGKENVISVSKVKGQIFDIKALDFGTATITVTDKKGQQATVSVSIEPTELELDAEQVTLAKTINAASVNILLGNGGYAFSYSTEGIVAATENNNVITITRLLPGSTVVTVTDEQGKTKNIDVTVDVRDMSLDKSNITLVTIPGTDNITIKEANGSNFNVVSSNTDVVEFTLTDNNVEIRGKKDGYAIITITDDYGASQAIGVTILPLAMKLDLDYCLIANYGALSNANDYKALSQVTYEVKLKLSNIRGLQGFIGLEGNLLLRGEHDDYKGDQAIELVTKLDNTEQKNITQNFMKRGVWYHLALVFDGTLSDATQRHKLYVNGELYTTFQSKNINFDRKTIDLTRTNNAPGFGIGRVGSGDHRGSNGIIAEARVWKVARTAEQIKDNMCVLKEQAPTGLISQWVLGAASPTAVDKIEDRAGTCDAVVYANKNSDNGGSNDVKNPKQFPADADRWVTPDCPK